MKKPTKKQFMILCDVEEYGEKEVINSDKDIELYWTLKENGYLESMKDSSLMYDWKFKLTEKGKSYINPGE